jgi:hypothetical protein
MTYRKPSKFITAMLIGNIALVVYSFFMGVDAVDKYILLSFFRLSNLLIQTISTLLVLITANFFQSFFKYMPIH